MTEITTARVRLRSPELADAEAVTAIVRDPRIYEKVARIPPEQTVEQTGRWILSSERGDELGTDHAFLITKDDAIIGTVGAHRPATDQPFEIGYWIAPQTWGKGIATEAACALIGWLEARGQADEIISGYFIDNPASGRVLEKLGFEKTETRPVYCLGRDCHVDHVYMRRRSAPVV